MYKKIIFVIIMTMLMAGCNGNVAEMSTESNNVVSKGIESETEVTEEIIEGEEGKVKTEQGYLEKSYYYDLKTLGLEGKGFYVYENNLPEGLILDEKTGIITGTAKKEGKYEYKVMIQRDEDPENYQIISFITVINQNLIMSKEVRSFIDVSKAANKTEITANSVITLPYYGTSPFFKYYGSNVEKIRVCQQGYIKIGDTTCSLTTDMNITTPINAIIPFGDPELIMGATSKIYYQIRGSAPNRMIIIQYKNMTRITDANSSHNFEVVLQEGSNSIQFLYDLSYSVADSGQKHLGKNALVGLSKQGALPLLVSNAPNPAVEPRSAQIFRGTVISFKAPAGAGQYEVIKDGNVVTDYVNIARIPDEAITCTSASQCTTNLCVNNKCSSANASNDLVYDNGKNVNLPFSFYFYGQVFNSIKIHENGFLYFSNPTTNYNTFPATPTGTNNIPIDYIIAPYYSNIDLKQVRGGNVTYNVLGTAPNRKFIVMYDDVRIKTTDNFLHLCSFQVVLNETSNVIEMLYGGSIEENPSGDQSTKFCNGNNAVIGIKKDNSTRTDIFPLDSATITTLVLAGKKIPMVGQGKSITFVPNDAQANSYTWTGLSNAINNSGSGSNQTGGGFNLTQGGWTEIGDTSAFLGYQAFLVQDMWVNTSGAMVLPLSDDSATNVHVTSSAIYKFYDQQYMDFYVQSNGGVTFTSDWMHYSEPADFNYAGGGAYPDKGIWAYWNDLNPSAGGVVRAGEYMGTDQNGMVYHAMVFEWNSIPRYYNTGNNTFQIQLWDTGHVVMCYDNIFTDSHLTGIRNNISQYIQVPNDIQSLINTNQCIMYQPVYQAGAGTRSTVSGTDNGIQPVNLPFNFNFRGRLYTQVTISANGAVAFGNVPIISQNNVGLNTATIPNDFLAVFWDDLDIRARNNNRAGVFYATTGTSPNRKFIVSYNDAAHYSMDPSYINAQIVLSEGSNEIKYCYGNLTTFGLGSSATIGVRETGTTYIQLSYNQAGLIQPNTCLTYVPPVVGYSSARNIFEGEMNTDFYDIPIKAPSLFGEEIKEFYSSIVNGQVISGPYAIFDLATQGYTFDFKGKSYDKLFVTGNGAVSFGNSNTAFLVTGPMWQDVFYNNEIQNQSHPSLLSPYDNVESNFMWIANAGNNTLSKINTYTGTKIGEYPVGSSPSRTAVGFDGSVWVGNRGSNNVTKLDRDGNHICTVTMSTSNWCGPRGLALDRDENLWVGCFWNADGYIYKVRHNKVTNTCEKIDMRAPGDTSSDLAYKGHAGHGIYGFAIDRNGIMWGSTWSESYIVRIDTNKQPGDTGFYKKFPRPGYNLYGLAVDLNGDVWYATYTNVADVTRLTYNPTTETVTWSQRPLLSGYGRGVAIDANGYIWIVSNNGNKISKYKPNGDPVAAYNSGGSLGIGAGVDGDGDVWINHQGNGQSCELDSFTGALKRCIYTGPSPYCYSDNTGFNLRNIVSGIKPTGYYAGIIMDPVSSTKCSRKLVVQWNNIRLANDKTNMNYKGYTEANIQLVFDNGDFYPVACNNVVNGMAMQNSGKVDIKFVYGSMSGNNSELKTGGKAAIVLRSLYSDYSHTFGSNDAGTVNSGSSFIIKGE